MNHWLSVGKVFLRMENFVVGRVIDIEIYQDTSIACVVGYECFVIANIHSQQL